MNTSTPRLKYGLNSAEAERVTRNEVDFICKVIVDSLISLAGDYPEINNPEIRETIFADLYASVESEMV